jgi:hypothetical protein
VGGTVVIAESRNDASCLIVERCCQDVAVEEQVPSPIANPERSAPDKDELGCLIVEAVETTALSIEHRPPVGGEDKGVNPVVAMSPWRQPADTATVSIELVDVSSQHGQRLRRRRADIRHGTRRPDAQRESEQHS